LASALPQRSPSCSRSSSPNYLPMYHWRNRLIIDPNDSYVLNVWDILVASLLITTALVAPFETAFLPLNLNSLMMFDCVVDTVFIIDLFLQFFIAYSDPVHPERLVKDQKRVVKHYLATWFTVDFVSALPLEFYRLVMSTTKWCMVLIPGLEHLEIIRLIRLLRLTRLARLFGRWHTSFGFSYANLSLAKFLAAVLLCCHWMACLWGAIGMVDPENPDRRTWLTALQEAKGGADELYHGPWQVYSISLYWAIITITSIGYGDITPQTSSEYWVATLCTSVMASIWAYVIGAVCGIVSTMHPHEVSFKRTMDDLNWLMCDRHMPYDMCKKIRRYFHETRDMTRQRTEQELIAQMSPKLQGEYAHFMHKRWIAKVWYLRSMNHEIIVWAARHLTMAVYAPHEEVLNDRTLFIVQRGLCALKGKVLVSGDIWGEDMLLSNEFLRETEKARSLGYLSVLMLHVLDLVDIVANFPEARARLRWAQVQIALMRGVQLIAKFTRELEVTRGLKSDNMTDEQRMELFTDILQGKFVASTIPEDYLGLHQAHRNSMKEMPPRLSMRLASASNFSISSELSDPCPDPRLNNLTVAVAKLTQQMQELGVKVDSLGSGPKHQRSGGGGGGGVTRTRSSLADFGPVVRPMISSNSTLEAQGSGRAFPLGQLGQPRADSPRTMLQFFSEGSGNQVGRLPTLLPAP